MPSDPTVAIHCDHVVWPDPGDVMCGIAVENSPELPGARLWRERTVSRSQLQLKAAPVANFVFMIRHPDTASLLCDGCVARIRTFVGIPGGDRQSLAMLLTFLRGLGAPPLESEIISSGIRAIERMLVPTAP